MIMLGLTEKLIVISSSKIDIAHFAQNRIDNSAKPIRIGSISKSWEHSKS
jgi:hypothetical protein